MAIEVCFFILLVEFSIPVLGDSEPVNPSLTTCNHSAISQCEMAKAGVHYEKSIDPCNFYEYWGNCLKSLERDCKGDFYYEERVHSYQFDGEYYCPWLFPDDQPAPGCDKRTMYQCKIKTRQEREDYYKTGKCPFLIKQRDCLESFRNSCSEYNKYSLELHNWKYQAHLDCPQLLGCNVTLYQSCWDKIDFSKVNLYDPSSFHALCGDILDNTLPCIIDQTERCHYQEETLLHKNKWNFQMIVYSCYGSPECNLVKLNECALDHYSENVWLMSIPTPKQATAICRKHKPYMRCVAPYQEACLKHKAKLGTIGHVSLSAVVDRMETLYNYLSLTCIEKYTDILTYGEDCFDTQVTSFQLFVCENDRIPVFDYAPDQQRCLSIQNLTSCIRNALSDTQACVEKSIETAQDVAVSWDQFLLSLHHGFTCDGSKPVRQTTTNPTIPDELITTEYLTRLPDQDSRRGVNQSNNVLQGHWMLCVLALIICMCNVFKT
ncbi:uncharacterized protein LOC133202539 [Saccostrea echinata]|uniref:uncharacterized protein LOC133202539 n=1 Tax=Saccostrea echinata TaxID=191078 RepID=UPI002A7EF8C3|nr:uncharacterized protein LOC133202539 [Saccostrea echinata]